MTDYEDYFSHRNNAARFQIKTVDDSKTENYHTVDGLEDETFESVIHIQPHGFSSIPPKGAHAVGVALGGRRDTLALLGGEHPDHKPKNLGDGNSQFYNHKSPKITLTGDDISTVADGKHDEKVKGARTIECESLTIKCGGVTVVIDKKGLHQTSGIVEHDKHDIGKTHLHKNAGGAGLSGEPQ